MLNRALVIKCNNFFLNWDIEKKLKVFIILEIDHIKAKLKKDMVLSVFQWV